MGGLIAFALEVATAFSGAVGHGVDLRVYVADKERKLVDPGDLEIAVHLDRPEAKRKTLDMELATPKGPKRFGLGHGGQIVKAEGYYVELVMFDPHQDLVDEEDGTPYVRADVSVVECPNFQAVVEFKVKGKLFRAEGFEYPIVPETYKDAVLKLENRISKLKDFATAGDAEATFLSHSLIAVLWKGVPALATVESRKTVDKACKDAVALAKELDVAVHAADAKTTVALLDRYNATIRELKLFVK